MPPDENMIAVPADVAFAMSELVRSGEFRNEGEVARAAMEEWRARRVPLANALAALRQDIATGLADMASDRVKDFDVSRIAALGRKASRSSSD